MLDSEKPNAVCLIAPVELTFGLASEVLEMGYPLILEKPPGTTGEETLKLVEIAGRKNVPNRVAFNRRFAPLSRRLKSLLAGNFKPEDIHNISGIYYENASFFDAVRAGRKPECDLASTVQSVEVAECMSNRVSEYRL